MLIPPEKATIPIGPTRRPRAWSGTPTGGRRSTPAPMRSTPSAAVTGRNIDEIIVCTTRRSTSRTGSIHDLPHRLEHLGLPVCVIPPDEDVPDDIREGLPTGGSTRRASDATSPGPHKGTPCCCRSSSPSCCCSSGSADPPSTLLGRHDPATSRKVLWRSLVPLVPRRRRDHLLRRRPPQPTDRGRRSTLSATRPPSPSAVATGRRRLRLRARAGPARARGRRPPSATTRRACGRPPEPAS